MAQNPPCRPAGIRAPHGARVFEIDWSDGRQNRLPHRILRGYCPCAGCQGHAGSIRFGEPPNLELMGIEQVGNYAVQLSWGDGHDSGIYTFAYLRRLGELFDRHGDTMPDALPTLPEN